MSSAIQRKRKRPLLSCVECRRRKIGCDREDPCGRCAKAEMPCVYQTQDNELGSRPSIPSGVAIRRAVAPPPALNSPMTSQTGSAVERDQHEPPPTGEVRGILSKARLLGTTHTINTYRECDVMYTDTVHEVVAFDTQALIGAAKRLARAMKNRPVVPFLTAADAIESLPSRQMVDTLVDNYLRVIEGPFRIFHIPTFRREYEAFWASPPSTTTVFVLNLLLVISIGARFWHDMTVEAQLRPDARRWVETAQVWSSNLHKELATLAGLQAQCLLSLARQFYQVKPQLVWLAQGTLLRAAIFMGLHRDGRYFPQLSFFQAEMRRRLWTTILELEVQSMMDTGMTPMLGLKDFDSKPPLNLNDEDFDSTTTLPPQSRPASEWTQSSLQLFLRQSLEVRMEIVCLVNNSFSEPSYEDILQWTGTLSTLHGDISRTMAQTTPGDPLAHHPNALDQNHLKYMTRRFFLALHRPFAVKAFHNPKYYYSRKVCVDNALLLLTPEADPDFDRLLHVSLSIFRYTMHHAATILCFDMIAQIKEDRSENSLLSFHQESRATMLETVRGIGRITERRLRFGETNVKSHIFLHMAIAQIDAMQKGLEIRPRILAASKQSAEKALNVLKEQSDLPLEATEVDYSRFENLETRQSSAESSLNPFKSLNPGDIDYDLGNATSWLFPGWEQAYYSLRPFE
ncbi:hypothetical protein N7457_004013 [Penicillium paradoxum]|uniref:uncharacterized protein n=1 Tax=Penicillium paradoxum TaxID=176176 RepID=UPI0025490ABE|nr:uncharacterized protein N7457_004013 [Penicillium paradoxum]KAJ5782239.1 hypothetical protein N7457_004013 [Penicillium paradoxum]